MDWGNAQRKESLVGKKASQGSESSPAAGKKYRD
jgi:hypothetical protein